MKKIILTAWALASLLGTAHAQDKVKVHNGNESYVTTIDYVTFDTSEFDEVVSIPDLKSENTILTTANTQLDGKNKELSTQLTTLTNKNAELTTANTQLEGENEELGTQLTTLTNKNTELTNANTQLDGKNKELGTQVTTLTNKNAELTTTNTQLEKKQKELSSQVTTLTNKNAELTTANTQLNSEKNELNTQVTTLTNKNTELTTTHTQLENEQNELNTQVTTLTNKNTELTTANTQLRGEKSELETKVATLEQEMDDLKNPKTGRENGHKWVNLGLKSGTLWATCNVGADTPESNGNFYAWGETEPQSSNTYYWTSYKLCKGDLKELKKYVTSSNNGVVDNRTELETIDDVAAQIWGGKWRMPTLDQLTELIEQCYWVWTDTYDGENVCGFIVYKAKSSSDKGVKVLENNTPSSDYNVATDIHIFLPAVGYRTWNNFIYKGTRGAYWSRSVYKGACHMAFFLEFTANKISTNKEARCYGLTVRPVCPCK